MGLFYPRNIECVWRFIDHDFGTYIVTVLDFATDWNDILTLGYGGNITDESRVALLRYTPQPLSFHIPYFKMWIRFRSYWGNIQRGFLLQVQRETELGKILKDNHR